MVAVPKKVIEDSESDGQSGEVIAGIACINQRMKEEPITFSTLRLSARLYVGKVLYVLSHHYINII